MSVGTKLRQDSSASVCLEAAVGPEKALRPRAFRAASQVLAEGDGQGGDSICYNAFFSFSCKTRGLLLFCD